MNQDDSPLRQKITVSPPPSVPWTSRDVAWGLGTFVVWIVVFGTVGIVAEQLNWPIDVGLLVIFGEAMLLLPVWYFTVHKYGVDWSALGLRGFRSWAVGMGCGLMLLSMIFNLLYQAFLNLFDLQIQPDIAIMFDNTNFPLALLVGGAILAPLVEEIFFRGFVFAGLRQRWSWQKAALVSAGLFALVHFVPTSVIPIFILGFIFALLYQISGSIWPAILMHMLTNTLALSAAYFMSQGWVPPPP